VLQLLDAAQRGPRDHRDALGGGVQPRAPAQVGGGGDEQRRGAGANPERRRRQLLDLAAPSDPEVGGGETLDRRQTIGAGQQAGPERVQIETDRRGHAAGDDRHGLRTQRSRSRCRRN